MAVAGDLENKSNLAALIHNAFDSRNLLNVKPFIFSQAGTNAVVLHNELKLDGGPHGTYSMTIEDAQDPSSDVSLFLVCKLVINNMYTKVQSHEHIQQFSHTFADILTCFGPAVHTCLCIFHFAIENIFVSSPL